jgi:hypothetical protein
MCRLHADHGAAARAQQGSRISGSATGRDVSTAPVSSCQLNTNPWPPINVRMDSMRALCARILLLASRDEVCFVLACVAEVLTLHHSV